MHSLAVISDLHAGRGDASDCLKLTDAELLALLKSLHEQAKIVVLNGDTAELLRAGIPWDDAGEWERVKAVRPMSWDYILAGAVEGWIVFVNGNHDSYLRTSGAMPNVHKKWVWKIPLKGPPIIPSEAIQVLARSGGNIHAALEKDRALDCQRSGGYSVLVEHGHHADFVAHKLGWLSRLGVWAFGVLVRLGWMDEDSRWRYWGEAFPPGCAITPRAFHDYARKRMKDLGCIAGVFGHTHIEEPQTDLMLTEDELLKSNFKKPWNILYANSGSWAGRTDRFPVVWVDAGPSAPILSLGWIAGPGKPQDASEGLEGMETRGEPPEARKTKGNGVA